MTLFYPSELPGSPLIDGFQELIPDGRTISQVTTGPGKRRAFWKGIRDLTFMVNMSANQWARLNSFWGEDTEGGVLPFIMYDPPSHRQRLLTPGRAPIYIDGGITIPGTQLLLARPWLVRFGKNPPAITQAMTPNAFKVSINIEVLP